MKRRKRIFWDQDEQNKVFARATLLQKDDPHLSNLQAFRLAEEEVLPANRQRPFKVGNVSWKFLVKNYEQYKTEHPEPEFNADVIADVNINNVEMSNVASASTNGNPMNDSVNAVNDLVITKEVVTPQIAENWLNNFNTTNRKLRSGIAEKYAADMRAGKWTICDSPIIFYDDGVLASGQHRLWAIIDADTPQQFVIWRNFPRTAALNIDTGAVRNLVDNARIGGKAELSPLMVMAGISIEVGDQRAMSGGQRALSYAQKLAIVQKHFDAVTWIAKNVKKVKYLFGTPVLGAIGRAYYFEDRERLQKFCEVLGTGFSEGPEDSAAIALRNFLLKLKADKISSTTNFMWPEVFSKAQNAIKYFCRKEPLRQIKTVAEEPYKLKMEQSAFLSEAAMRIVNSLKQQPKNTMMWTELFEREFGNRRRETVQQALAELASQKVVSLQMVKATPNAKKLATVIKLEAGAAA